MMDSINYNKDQAKVFAFGVDPFDRMGLEEYLDYTVICYHDFNWLSKLRQKGLKVYSLKEEFPNIQLPKINTQSVLLSEEVKSFINKFGIKYFLIYKNNEVIQKATQNLGIKVLANSYEMALQLENKIAFREMFKDKAPIPPYIIKSMSEVHGTEENYNSLKQQFGKFVIQDQKLSGGKGTFIVDSFEEYSRAHNFLKNTNESERLVISKFIKGRVTSLQVCVTKYGIISTGLQNQIIGDGSLQNKNIDGEEQFCGGEWGYKTYSDNLNKQAYEIAQSIGKELQKMGYKGIFGIDTIAGEDEKLSTIEINARITGMTPFLTMLQNYDNEIPVLLLHALELADIEYTIDKPELLQDYFTKYRKGSYMILHNSKTEPLEVKAQLQQGVYNFKDDKLTYSHHGYRLEDLQDDNQIILPNPPNQGTIIEPGKRILKIMSLEESLNSEMKLNERYQKVVEAIRNSLST